MSRLLIYYAHPGHNHSRINRKLAEVAEKNTDFTFVDLYREYPRFDINVDREQERLLEHDIIVFQHPLFWYSTPSIIKEWTDLVLEHGFAFGAGGNKLEGKVMMNAISAAGPLEAYTEKGYQHHSLRTFLTPLEQTARLCHMKYSAPYVLFSALDATEQREIAFHVKGYENMLRAIKNDHFDFDKAICTDFITFENLDHFVGGAS